MNYWPVGLLLEKQFKSRTDMAVFPVHRVHWFDNRNHKEHVALLMEKFPSPDQVIPENAHFLPREHQSNCTRNFCLSHFHQFYIVNHERGLLWKMPHMWVSDRQISLGVHQFDFIFQMGGRKLQKQLSPGTVFVFFRCFTRFCVFVVYRYTPEFWCLSPVPHMTNRLLFPV